MKRFLLVFVAFVTLVSLPVQAEDTHKQQLLESVRTWKTLRAKCGGHYSYTKSFSSFSGFGNITTITVKNNQVVERSYKEFGGPPVPVAPGQEPPKDGPKWVEQGDQLGSHKQGAPAKTLDQLYKEAAEILKTPLEPHQKLYVRFDKQGLLQSCFYIDTRIADDAPTTGVSIGKITLGAP